VRDGRPWDAAAAAAADACDVLSTSPRVRHHIHSYPGVFAPAVKPKISAVVLFLRLTFIVRES